MSGSYLMESSLVVENAIINTSNQLMEFEALLDDQLKSFEVVDKLKRFGEISHKQRTYLLFSLVWS